MTRTRTRTRRLGRATQASSRFLSLLRVPLDASVHQMPFYLKMYLNLPVLIGRIHVTSASARLRLQVHWHSVTRPLAVLVASHWHIPSLGHLRQGYLVARRSGPPSPLHSLVILHLPVIQQVLVNYGTYWNQARGTECLLSVYNRCLQD